jgi:hypothetical protein
VVDGHQNQVGKVNVTEVATRKIVVCDDDAARVKGWATDLSAVLDGQPYDIKALSPGEFGDAVGALHERVKASKAGQAVIRADKAEVFDGADILILDSDLTPDPQADVDKSSQQSVDENLVGEYGSNVARLARAYSTAGVLIVVNHIYRRRTFDLTMTRFGDLPADVYIAAPDLDSAGLWNGTVSGAFRPWAWPNISKLAAPDERIRPDLALESLVLDCIGLLASEAELIEGSQWERLSFDVAMPQTLTLRDVAHSSTFGIGPIAQASAPDSQLLRVAKSAVRRWLEHVVLPAQNAFVDLPHMLQDRPWLAPSARKDAVRLSELVASSWEDHQEIAPAAYAEQATTLLGRAVWRVDQLPNRESGDRLDSDDFVFCEDTSDFRHPSEAHEFESDILGPFRTRFVAKLAGVDYTPARRLLL